MSEKYKVSVSKRGDRSTEETIREALDRLGGIERFIKPGQRVMLKPNFTGDLDASTGAVTSNEALEGMIRLLIKAGVSDITIAEGSGTVHIGTANIYKHLGVVELAEKYGVKLVDMNTCAFRTVRIEKAKFLKEVQFSEALFGYDLVINMPVIKTHIQAVFTCAVKNMKGAVAPRWKRYFHANDLNQCIADFQLALPRMITVVDGLTGQDGMGPCEGDPVPLDLILAGENSVAVDGVALAIAEIDACSVKYLKMCEELGAGSFRLEDIEVLGEQIQDVKRRFRPAIAETTGYDGVEIDCANACSGCSNTVYIALERLRKSGDLEKIKDLQIKCGAGKPCFAEQKNRFFMGKCSKAAAMKEGEVRNDVHYVEGCAPCASELEEAIRESCRLPRH